MLTGYPLSCTLGRGVLGIGSGVARFLMIAEYATYRYRLLPRIIRTPLFEPISEGKLITPRIIRTPFLALPP